MRLSCVKFTPIKQKNWTVAELQQLRQHYNLTHKTLVLQTLQTKLIRFINKYNNDMT